MQIHNNFCNNPSVKIFDFATSPYTGEALVGFDSLRALWDFPKGSLFRSITF